MGKGAVIRSEYAGTKRNARSFAGALLLFGTLCTTSSCVSEEQKRVVLSWYDTSESATKLQERPSIALISTDTLIRRIGKPDQRVPAKSLAKSLPGRWGSDEIHEAVEQRRRQLSESGRDPAAADDEINASEFWLYDESARYKSPSQPDSLWGMGTGFQVVWFAVYKDQVVASGGFGLRKTRRLTVH